ncbi:hypothetical protein JOL79_16460 [Microbispora sp. RL4-1S]|uniref:Uncharacterized protein n=1 Tax=Microbispora oryzae TaxID=2806554 RepID=A0A940WGT2_9ACTN|nr:hypothetical protein [Microbispora oryzae]MBP2705409.1 hypothetical protein [Microbispora oryzae]
MVITQTTPHTPLIDLQEAHTHYRRARHLLAYDTPALAEILAALDHIPALCAESARLRAQLARIRMERANLIAAAHATLAAHNDGEADPLSYLRDELAAPDAGLPRRTRDRYRHPYGGEAR